MNILSMENVSKTLKDAPLFEQVSLGINLQDRIGLIGPNGSGKTTFLNLVTGKLEPDTGSIARNRELRISLLEQDPLFEAETTIAQSLYIFDAPIISLLNEYRSCLESHGSPKRLQELIDQIDAHHGWEVESTYYSLLSELGLPDPQVKISELSGGMRKKAALARSLAVKPNLIILDEPTNHLDIPTIEWLERYIIHASLGCIVVTHDRYFLDSACTKIFEIDRKSIFSYEGNYSAFLEMKQQRDSIELAGQRKIEAVLRDEMQWLKRGPKARTGKDKGRKQRIEDLMDTRITREHDQSRFSSSHRKLGKKVLELTSICKSFNGKPVISPLSYSFKQGERIGLIGPNGSGKTTLLDLITGHIPLDGGSVDWGVNTRWSYYDQMNRPFNEDQTVLEFITRDREQIPFGPSGSISAARFLELFGFDVSFHRIALSRLSGGEKRRLYLLSILAEEPNFLILDEPTNDLDIQTLERLEEYISSFKGCALIVSHDRSFLDRTTDYLFIFDGSSTISGFAGTYSDYSRVFSSESPKKEDPDPIIKNPVNRRRRLTFKEQREFDSLMGEIDLLEQEKSSLEQDFLTGANDLEQKNRRYQEVLHAIEKKSLRWEHLAEIDENS